MQLPTRNAITLPFGSTLPPYNPPAAPHRGCDFGWLGPDTRNVYAAEDCTLAYVANNGNDGNALYAAVGNHRWGYLHLERPVKTGPVKQGDLIGVMGSSGAADGIHLHLALMVDGVYSDPVAFINENKGDDMAEMTQSAAEKVVTYLYRLGTGDYPNPGQAEYWVPRVRDVPTGVDELGTEMLKGQKPSEYVKVSDLYIKK